MITKEKSPKGIKRSILVKLPFLLLIPFGLWLPSLASTHPLTVERLYSRVIYPHISRALGVFTSLPGFSVAEFFVYFVILGVLIAVIANVVGLIRRKKSPAAFLSFLLSLAIFAGVMLNLFYILWGFNYSRPTLYQLAGLEVKARPEEELQALCHKLSADANELRKSVPEDENLVFHIADYRKHFDKIPAAYEKLTQSSSLFAGKVYPAKGVIASEGMSWAGICGIFMPFTAEANVNIHQPSLLLPASAAHESAHFLGFAREDEANFIAYLACMSSDDPSIRYSGAMLALIHCGNALQKSAPDKAAALRETYSDAVLRDIAAYNQYWDRYDGQVEEAFDSINDSYLKFNLQENGVKSYGMMVDLMLAYYDIQPDQ
ncbi:MAG: DUF3810 domain-containing protein [Eubacteriales bacterium]|nr:DUF3810 domain-containing protein [Eubacteriales bacterium]